jgi:hypothetical protein
VQPAKPPFEVVVGDERLVSHAGVALLAELADRLGLTGALERLVVGDMVGLAGTSRPGSCAI